MVWKVESATWVQRLTDDHIEDLTDVGTFHRGQGYAQGGMVTQAATLNRGRGIVAKVMGSGPDSYQTIVSLDGDPDAEVIAWSGRCSCPVGTDCKHAVAVLLTVRDHLGGVVEAGPAAPRWEEALSGLTEAATAPLERGSSLALVVESVRVAQDPYDRIGVPRVRIRPTRRTKAGHWAKKCSWSEVLDRGFVRGRPSVHPDHGRALETLVAMHRVVKNQHGYRHGLDAPYPNVYLDDFGPEIWPTLRRLRDAGVALIASEAGEQVTVDEVGTEIGLDALRASDGVHLRSTVASHPEGPDDDTVELQLIGDPGHGVALLGDTLTLAPLSGPITPALTALVRDPLGLTIPEEDVDRFLALYLGRLREQVTVISSDGSVDLPQPAPPRLHVHVRGEGGGVRLDLGFAYAAGSSVHVVPAGAGGSVPRDTKGEQALLAGVEALAEIPGAVTRAVASMHRRMQTSVTLTGPSAIRVVTEVLPLLEEDERVLLEVDEDVPAYEELDAEPRIAIHEQGGQSESDWLDLGITVTVGEIEVPFEALFHALVRGEEIMQLETGEWFRLDHPVLIDLRALIEEARALAEPESGQLRLSRYQVGLWDELADLGDVDIEREHSWLRSVEALREIDVGAAPALPESFAATLRPYQLDGYHWLTTLWDSGLGGVLADDMGLGKTVQALALIARAAEAGELDEPVLVIAPTSVVGTWAGEAARFAPDLDVRVLAQTHTRRGATVAESTAGADLVVTSYAVLRIDAEEFADVPWRGVLIDEAQYVKNSRSKTHHAIRRLSAPFVLVVTGTPLENSLMDLWSMLALAAPGLYPRRETFVEVYRKPIESGAEPELLDRLRRRIRPLMLRRTKEAVALDLPPKQVQVTPVELSPTHRRVYDRHLQRERKRVLGLLDDPDANRVAILASLTRLRQLSLAPELVDDADAGTLTSAKVDLLVEHLHELAEEGHRVLVFSQFTRFLGLVRERLTAEGLTTCYLDGATRDRAAVIEEFRSGDALAFLISLKAGGVGLTLTEADYVYVLDPWWNPAAEAQAIDRAHRIGQDRPVMVHRLVSSGTIEEKVLALQERKRDLFERVVDDGGALSGKITSEDIRALLDTE